MFINLLMTTTHTNIAIVEGEVYILEDKQLTIDGSLKAGKIIDFWGSYVYILKSNVLQFVLASTAKLEGIPQLDRKHFVKPKVNPITKAYEELPDCVKEHLNYVSFEIGYNAKEAEFTMDDILEIWDEAKNDKLELHQVINKLRPLSLPKSVTLNENNEIINVQW